MIIVIKNKGKHTIVVLSIIKLINNKIIITIITIIITLVTT